MTNPEIPKNTPEKPTREPQTSEFECDGPCGYTLYKITRTHRTGDPMDESEDITFDTEYTVVSSDKEDDFGEWCAEEAGSQDYAYQFNAKKILVMRDIDSLRVIKDALGEINTKKEAKLICGECGDLSQFSSFTVCSHMSAMGVTMEMLRAVREEHISVDEFERRFNIDSVVKNDD